MTALSQGFMLGIYILGLRWTWASVAFAFLTAGALTVAYSFIGAAWTILKTDGALQTKAVRWARGGIWGVVLGMGSVSLATPLTSDRIMDKWFGFPEIVLLAPLPLCSLALIVMLWVSLRNLPSANDRFAWLPFVGAIGLMALGFAGMAYSFYPYIVPEQMVLYDAAAAPESLRIIFYGALIVIPVILAYTVLAYVIFRGKATQLSYD
jgi:cytochrome d ubiquinol oxidase subunit II